MGATLVLSALFLLSVLITHNHGVGIGRYRNLMITRDFHDGYDDVLNEERTRPKLKSFSLTADNIAPNIHACDYGLCEEDPKYPKSEILMALKNTEHVATYFGSLSAPHIINTEENEWERGDEICQTRIRKIRPKTAYNVNGELRYLINIDKTPYQMELVGEVCDEDVPCTASHQPLNKNQTCKQKYGEIKLLTYELGATKLAYDIFRHPITCVCVIT